MTGGAPTAPREPNRDPRVLRDEGFREIEILSRLDYFAASSSAETRKVAASFGAHTFLLRAVLPTVSERERSR